MLEYELRLPPDPADPVPENNRARCLVQIQGRRPVLCITPSGASGFANLLRRGGLDVVDRDPAAGTVDLASLAGCSAVILENTPAGALGRHGLELLAAWVRETGGGLMTTGGRHAYGPGGYYGSALESVLPVTLELRQDQRKFALALVLAMDRSGSMSAPVAGSRTKMDLANLGALQVLGLLGPFDRFGLLAVDSTAHTVVPLLPSDRARARAGDIRRIASQGGGIFIYEALSNALRMLSNDDGAAVGARHILLFADAADSEEPGEYRELLARATAAGITVSVVGLGSPADTDAGLLRDIAHRGSGQCFFTQDALDVPRLFVQDTFTVARTALVTEPTATAFTAAAQLLDADRYAPPPVIGGYNLCYLRPEALAAAVTCDESRAPVVAFWQVGAGRALAFTGAVDGELSDPLARWPHAGAFLTGLARWTAGPDEGLPGVVPLVRPIPGGLRIELHCDPDESAGASTPWRDAPRLLVLHELPGAPPRLTVHRLDWETPDLLTAEVLATGREVLLPVIQVRGQEPVTLAPFCLPYSPEHAPGPAANGSHLLAECARISGGQERNDAPTVWQSLRKSRTPVPLAPYLYLAAAGLFLLEVFERRTGRLPAGRRLQRLRRPRPLALAAGSARAATPPGELSAPQSDEAGEPAAHAALPAPPTAPATAPATAPDPLTQARERSRNRINRRTP